MPIEILPEATLRDIRLKLNEVIEAVNEIKAYLVPIHPDSALDRIDAMLFEQPPESVQQEKEATLDETISVYAKIIREHERHKVDGMAPYPKGVAEARQAIFSAAQREYSQKAERE